MFFVVGVLQLVKEVRIAVGATAIFRRASSLPLHAARVANAFFDGQGLLNVDAMLPIIPKIVIVAESQAASLDEIAQSDRACIVELAPTFEIPVFFTIDDESVHVLIVPIHADLDNVVQFVQGAVVHLHPPPDQRLDVVQRDLDLVDGQGRM